MSITQNGNSFTWDGTVTVTNATDLTTGVATLMLTPAGGVGSLPALAQGLPGQPALFDSITVTTLSAGSQATGSITPVSSGSSGTNSHYAITLGIPQGATGTQGPYTIVGATDFAGTPTNGSTLVYNGTTNKWTVASQSSGNNIYSAQSFTAVSGNSSPATLATINIPAQSFNWLPTVSGNATPSGTINTTVNLRCLLDNPTSGQQIGYGYGYTGAGSNVFLPALPVTLLTEYGGNTFGGYGVVSAGQAATLYFQAVQTSTTTDSWSIPTNSMNFTVFVNAIPNTNI